MGWVYLHSCTCPLLNRCLCTLWIKLILHLYGLSVARFKMLNYRIGGSKLLYINSNNTLIHILTYVTTRTKRVRARAHRTSITYMYMRMRRIVQVRDTYVHKSTCSLIRLAACLLDEQNVRFSVSRKDSISGMRHKIELNILKISKWQTYRTFDPFWNYWSYEGLNYCTNAIIIVHLATLYGLDLTHGLNLR